jgi:hypothetical protein
VAAALSAGTLAAGASALAQPAEPHVVRGEAVWQGVPPCAQQSSTTLSRN